MDAVEYQVVKAGDPQENGRCCLTGTREAVSAVAGVVGGVEGALNAIELMIGWGLVGPPGAGGTLKIDVSGKARETASRYTSFLDRG